MAAVETKFKVTVDGVEEYIKDLAQAEELINDISDKLKNGDLSLDEQVELTETLDNLEEIKVTMTLTNQIAEKQVETVAKQNTELGKQVGIVEAQLQTVDILNEAYALQNKEIGEAKQKAEILLAVTELNNEAQVLATTELGKQKAQAETLLAVTELNNEAQVLATTELGKQKAEAEILLAVTELNNEAIALGTTELGKAKSEAERFLEITELNNEATTLATTEYGRLKSEAERFLEITELNNEAQTLQNKEIGLAKAKAEAKLAVVELENEAEALLTSELGKQKRQAEANLVIAEAQAESMAATPGSIRQLNAELEKANLELANLSPDSEGFKEAKNRAEQLQIQVDGLSRSSKDQREANFALADSFVGTFGKGGALVSSFAGENQNLQAVLLKLEQAMAAVEAVRSAIVLVEQVQNELRLKQGKKLAEAKLKEIKASQDKAKSEKKEVEVIKEVTKEEQKLEKQTKDLTEANNDLSDSNKTVEATLEQNDKAVKDANTELKKYESTTKNVANNSEKAGKSTGAFGNSFSKLKGGFSAASAGAKGFGASLLATGIPIIIASVVALGAILVILKDKFKPIAVALNFIEDSVAGFGAAVFKVFPLILKYYELLFTPIKAIYSLITGGTDAAIATLKNGVNGFIEAGKDVGDAFNKGFDKSRNLRLNAEREALNKLTDIAANNQIAQLSLQAKNADKVSELKQRELKEDAEIVKEKLLLTNNLSEAEYKILTEGTEAEIAALKERLKARGDFSDSLIEGLQEVADKENELAAEQKAQFDARVDAAKELRDLQLDIQTERLANEVGTDAEITRAKIGFEKTNNDINARLAKGEKVNLEERKLAQIKLANELAAIQKGISERTRDNLNSAKDIQEQADIDELIGAEAKSDKLIDVQEALAKNLQGIQKQSAFELEKIARDEQIALASIKDPSERASKEAEFAAQRVQIAKKTELEIVKNAKASADAIEKDRLKKAGEVSKVIAGQAKLLTDKAKAQTEEALNRDKNSKAKSLALLKESLANELQAIKEGEESQLIALGLSNEQIQLLREKGVDGLSAAYKNLDKNVLDSAKNITDSSASATAQVIKDNAKNVAESEKGLIRITSKQQAAIDLATQILSAGLDNISAFTQQASEAQLAALDKQAEEVNKRLDETNTRLDESKSKTDELNENLKKARGSERKSILANLKAIQNQEKALTKQKLDDEAKLKAIDEQKKAEQRKQAEIQKAVAISNAIIQTALAVISALGNTSIPAPFSLPFAITVGVIGAASIAQIAAQPIPEFAEGGYTPNVDKNKPVGVVHGGEWVAPKWMVESPKYRNDIFKLERMRTNGYAQGGIVTATPSTNIQDGADKKFNDLINGIGALAERPIYTNVVTVSDEQNRINNIRTKASL